MRPLVEVQDPTAIESGLFPSLAPNQSTLWRDGYNTLFADGKVRKFAGYTVENTLAEGITGMAQAFVDDQKRVYYGTGTKLYARTDGVQTQIGSGYAGGRWSLEPWGNWLLATNNVDLPQIWKNGGAMVDWDGGPARAQLVKKLSNFPILFAGQSIWWPSLTDIENFTVTAESRAGQQFVRDLDSDFRAAEPMGQLLAYYTAETMGTIGFIGGTAVFSVTPRVEGVGAVGPHSVCAVGQLHYGLSSKGLWRNDGVDVQPVGSPAVAQWVQDNVKWPDAASAICFYHEQRDMVCWFFKCNDDVVRGLGYRPANGAWTRLEVPVVGALNQQVYTSSVVAVGATASTVGLFDRGDNAGPDPLPSGLTTGPLYAGQRGRLKRWDMVKAYFANTGGMEVRFGFQESDRDAVEWTSWRALTRDNWVDQGRDSVYLTVDLRSTALGASWELSGLDLYGEIGARTQ